jgi:hypothetical protein
MKNLSSEEILKTIKVITDDYRKNHLPNHDDYDHDEEGNIISCCGDIVDEDIMICPTCKEHQ